MVYRTKRNRFFIGFISITSIILLLSFLLPIPFDHTLQLQDLNILAVVLFSVIGLYLSFQTNRFPFARAFVPFKPMYSLSHGLLSLSKMTFPFN